MSLEVDHVFILVQPGAKVADKLLPLGFEESFGRDHPGQGTSNRRFRFADGLLEFLWVRDADEAENGPAQGLRFPQRVATYEASPFGIVLRRKDQLGVGPTIQSWTYQPVYFEAPKAFRVGTNSSELREPLCIYAPFIEPIQDTGERHTGRSITSVTVHCPVNEPTEILAAFADVEGLTMVYGKPHLMEICLNQGRGGRSNDFRPDIPLIIHS
ncbi:MAG: hypothetical protein CME36_14885 [unclassified Hahellaceae]|nr:hypothetical protein [Hahellaceae bacterium]|tara:strand:- start:12901 stop:13539 length:639 start_codon:yes stop_codon:yes gene_type:complete